MVKKNPALKFMNILIAIGFSMAAANYLKNSWREKMKILRPLKAIRAKCLDCCGGSAREVALCEIEDCPLFPYRFGKRPQTLQKKAVFSKKTQRSCYSNPETPQGGYGDSREI